jgi:hypothetical protein
MTVLLSPFQFPFQSHMCTPDHSLFTFTHLGIKTPFKSLESYAKWLGLKPVGVGKVLNIIEVVSAYAQLRETNALPEKLIIDC